MDIGRITDSRDTGYLQKLRPCGVDITTPKPGEALGLRDFVFRNRGYIRVLGKWQRMHTLNEHCADQRENQILMGHFRQKNKLGETRYG